MRETANATTNAAMAMMIVASAAPDCHQVTSPDPAAAPKPAMVWEDNPWIGSLRAGKAGGTRCSLFVALSRSAYSHSIVAGGLDEMS
jgi:hypothetical protein